MSPLSNEIIRSQRRSEGSSDEHVDLSEPPAIKAYHVLLSLRNIIDKSIAKVDALFEAGEERDLVQAAIISSKSQVESAITNNGEYSFGHGCSLGMAQTLSTLQKFR